MSHSVLPENYASDHLAVKATLKVILVFLKAIKTY